MDGWELEALYQIALTTASSKDHHKEALKSSILSSDFPKLSEYVEQLH